MIESSVTLGTTEEEEIGQFRNSSPIDTPIDTNRSAIELRKTEKELGHKNIYLFLTYQRGYGSVCA